MARKVEPSIGSQVWGATSALPWDDALVTSGTKCNEFCNAITAMHPSISSHDGRYLGTSWTHACADMASRAHELGTPEEVILFLVSVHIKG